MRMLFAACARVAGHAPVLSFLVVAAAAGICIFGDDGE